MKLKTIAILGGLTIWCVGILELQGWIMKKWPINSCDDERKKKQQEEITDE